MEMIVPDDWDEESFCRWAVCWPNSIKWKAILYGLIEQPMQGRFWDFSTGNFLDLREKFRPAYDENIELSEVIMACGDPGLTEIADAINNLATATATASATASASGCCGDGAAGQGQSEPPSNPTVEGEPATDPPPEGFENWDSYFANKCAIATDIMDTLISDFARMRLINLTGLIITSLIPILAGVLLTPVPVDDIAVIGGILLAVLALGAALIDTTKETLTNHKDEFICTLFEATSSAAAESAFEADFAQFYSDDGQGFAPYYFSAVAAINSMMNPAVTNRLFAPSSLNLPAGDCAACEDCSIGWDFVAAQSDLGWNVTDTENFTFTEQAGGAGVGWLVRGTVTSSPGFYSFALPLSGLAPIVAGQCLHAHAILGTTTTFYIIARFASAPTTDVVIFGSGTASGDNDWFLPLDSYVGQTIVRLHWYAAWGAVGAPRDVEYRLLEYLCEPCP